MHKISFEIETLAPVVISSASNSTVMTSTHSEIGGAIIRGVLAKKFISEKNLKTPYLDAEFKKFFYGDLKFLSATPKILNRRSFILPLSLQSGKKGTEDENKILDLLSDKEPPRGYKSFRGYGIIDEKEIFRTDVKKNISLHMSRNLENERLSGKSEEGHIYNYESIDAGQKFCGEILGKENDLKKFVEILNLKNNSMKIFVGKSRFTQYGKCKISFGDVEEIILPQAREKIFLRLESPLISEEDYFIDAEKILRKEIVDVLNKTFDENIFSLGKIFASAVEVENFLTHWSMKRPRVLALSAGTVFELHVSKILYAENFKILAEKIFAGFGMRTEEGFGQARFWQVEDVLTYGKIEKSEIVKPKNFSKKTLEIAEKILLARCLEQIRIYAHDDAEKLKLRGENLTHFFSRLDSILSSFSNSADVQKNFQLQLESEIRGGSLFETNLKNLQMINGQSFYDVLTGRANLPRSAEDLKKNLNFGELLQELNLNLDFVQKKFFAEYLKNYFRFARKFSAKGGDKNE